MKAFLLSNLKAHQAKTGRGTCVARTARSQARVPPARSRRHARPPLRVHPARARAPGTSWALSQLARFGVLDRTGALLVQQGPVSDFFEEHDGEWYGSKPRAVPTTDRVQSGSNITNVAFFGAQFKEHTTGPVRMHSTLRLMVVPELE